MDYRIEGLNTDQSNDVIIRQMFEDIFNGLREKLVHPVLAESQSSSMQLQKSLSQVQAEVLVLQDKIAELDARLQQVPLIILASFRDALNQAGKDIQNE